MSIRIEQDPTFDVNVKIPRVGGEVVEVPFTFKYLDRDQIVSFFETESAHKVSYLELIGKNTEIKALNAASVKFELDQLSKIIAGWGFDDPFNKVTLKKLVNTNGIISSAILDAFKAAYVKAREGN